MPTTKRTPSKQGKRSTGGRPSGTGSPPGNRPVPTSIMKYGRRERASTRKNSFRGGRDVCQGNEQAGILLGGQLEFQGRTQPQRDFADRRPGGRVAGCRLRDPARKRRGERGDQGQEDYRRGKG